MAEFDNRYINNAVSRYMKNISNSLRHFDPDLYKNCSRRNAIRKILIGTLGANLIFSTAGCKSSTSPDIEEPVYQEDEGVDVMMRACKDKGLTATDEIPPESEMKFYIPCNGKMVEFKPDFLIEMPGNPYHAFGEFLSSKDGFITEQIEAALYYNSNIVNVNNRGKGAIVMVTAGKTETETYKETQKKLKELYLIA